MARLDQFKIWRRFLVDKEPSTSTRGRPIRRSLLLSAMKCCPRTQDVPDRSGARHLMCRYKAEMAPSKMACGSCRSEVRRVSRNEAPPAGFDLSRVRHRVGPSAVALKRR